MHKCVFFCEKGRPRCGLNAARKSVMKSTRLIIVCFSLALLFIHFHQLVEVLRGDLLSQHPSPKSGADLRLQR